MSVSSVSAAISFYDTAGLSSEAVLVALLNKALAQGKRSLVIVENKETLEQVDKKLWTGAPWLPHLRADDSEEDINLGINPIIISTREANRIFKNIDYIFILGGPLLEDFELKGERKIVLFQSANSDEVARARQCWKALKDKDASLVYYKQNQDGVYEKKYS